MSTPNPAPQPHPDPLPAAHATPEDSGMRRRIGAMAEQLTALAGIRAVALGGSRVRGTHRPGSDWDLGLYYRGTPDLAALTALAGQVQGSPVEVAGPGGWGPWVDGGAWLRVDGTPVDWILRDLDRVEAVWSDCRQGRFEVGIQPGHPLGFWSPAYPGEVALGQVLADAEGELTRLQQETLDYPEPLRKALTDAAWEADFLVVSARKSAPSGDRLHVSLCLSRAFGILAQSLHAHHRTWCLNEKGALAAAAALPDTPADFAERVGEALRGLDGAAGAGRRCGGGGRGGGAGRAGGPGPWDRPGPVVRLKTPEACPPLIRRAAPRIRA